MADVDWPEDLSAPLRAGWRGSQPDGVRRSAMDAGPPKRRGESTAVGYVEPFPHKWTDAELATFDAFYAANKATRFNFTHPKWGAVEACFDGPAEITEQSNKNLVTVRLEIYR